MCPFAQQEGTIKSQPVSQPRFFGRERERGREQEGRRERDSEREREREQAREEERREGGREGERETERAREEGRREGGREREREKGTETATCTHREARHLFWPLPLTKSRPHSSQCSGPRRPEGFYIFLNGEGHAGELLKTFCFRFQAQNFLE